MPATPTPRAGSGPFAVRVAWCSLLVFGLLPACSDDPVGPGSSAGGALGPGVAGRWTTAAPESQGLDPDIVRAFEERIDAGDHGDVSSLLVLRNGVLVYEAYGDDWGPADVHRVYSVTKSVTAILVGIAIGAGVLPGVDSSVLDLLPGYAVTENPAPGKSLMTMEHVLQMRTGLEWDELSTNYTDDTNPTLALVGSEDWIQHVLDLPLSSEPGTRFAYNSGVSMLMSGVLTAAVGESAEGFAARELFGPLGIGQWQWSEGPGGLTNSGWGLRLRPRDMAAVGQMVLQAGLWEGRSLVPSSWIESSALPATRFTDGTGYGYQWWLGPVGSGSSAETGYLAAWGWGGQFIVILPVLHMVVVSTAENYAGGGLDPHVLADFAYRAAGFESGVP